MTITTDPQRPAVLHADGRVWVPTYRGWIDPSPLQPSPDPVTLYLPVTGRQYRGSITLSDADADLPVHPRSLREYPIRRSVLDSREEGRAYYNPESIIIIDNDGMTSLAALTLDRDYDSWLES